MRLMFAKLLTRSLSMQSQIAKTDVTRGNIQAYTNVAASVNVYGV